MSTESYAVRMRFILLGLAAAVLGDRNKGGVSCGPQDLEEGEVVVGCVKRYECESPDGAWHLCPNEVKMAHPLVHCRLHRLPVVACTPRCHPAPSTYKSVPLFLIRDTNIKVAVGSLVVRCDFPADPSSHSRWIGFRTLHSRLWVGWCRNTKHTTTGRS